MKEYIEREALLKQFLSNGSLFTYGTKTVAAIISRINMQPSANVAEVRHGYWKQNPHCKRIYYCSECGRHIEDGSNKPIEFFPYCHCGAKMDGKGEDNVNL